MTAEATQYLEDQIDALESRLAMLEAEGKSGHWQPRRQFAGYGMWCAGCGQVEPLGDGQRLAISDRSPHAWSARYRLVPGLGWCCWHCLKALHSVEITGSVEALTMAGP